MAALDPCASPVVTDETAPNDALGRATLKIIRSHHDSEDESEGESDEGDYLQALLGGGSDSDGESHDSDEDSDGETEENGGPSDPERTKKALKQKEKEDLEKMLAQDDDDDDEQMSVDKPNGLVNKGKAKATGDESDSDEEGEELDVETFVICTLDSNKVSQPSRSPREPYSRPNSPHYISPTSNLWISQSAKMSRFSSRSPALTLSILLAIM
jgi:FK506-binding nuclear protein